MENKQKKANGVAILAILLILVLIFGIFMTLRVQRLTKEKQTLEIQMEEQRIEIERLQKESDTLKKEVEAMKAAASAKAASSQAQAPAQSGDPLEFLPRGTGKNHNEAANAYAYSTEAVRLASCGKALYDNKLAFLTFDDGPNNTVTVQILDILKEKGVPATFFIPTKNVTDKTAAVLKRQYDEGHGIALHSHDHDYEKLYPGRTGSTEEIISQAKKGMETMKKYLGSDFETGVWRYPGGHMSWKGLADADAQLAQMGIHWIDWNSMTGDAEPASRRPTSAQGQVDFLKKTISTAANSKCLVILSHDAGNKDITVAALGPIIDQLKADGYAFGILE